MQGVQTIAKWTHAAEGEKTLSFSLLVASKYSPLCKTFSRMGVGIQADSTPPFHYQGHPGPPGGTLWDEVLFGHAFIKGPNSLHWEEGLCLLFGLLQVCFSSVFRKFCYTGYPKVLLICSNVRNNTNGDSKVSTSIIGWNGPKIRFPHSLLSPKKRSTDLTLGIPRI